MIKDVPSLNKKFFSALSKLFAKRTGIANTVHANIAADDVKPTDLVFLDPPYSAVQYSRFYHVLESVPPELREMYRIRPESDAPDASSLSLQHHHWAKKAFAELLGKLGAKGARVIVTFPAHECSNGLSGDVVRSLAREHFKVKEKLVQSRFSTLGGVDVEVGNGRAARHPAEELILTLSPK